MQTRILLAHQYFPVPQGATTAGQEPAHAQALGTLLSNLAYFGYAPSLGVLERLRQLSMAELASVWAEAEPALKALTGDDRDMAQFVVYKNFPAEVLALCEAHYWVNQIFMYLGAPAEWFTQAPQERAALDDRLQLKALHLPDAGTLAGIFQQLVGSKTRWTDAQREQALYLVGQMQGQTLDLSQFGFKENGVALLAPAFNAGAALLIPDATDVMRLAAALSDSDVSLRGEVQFCRFTRAQRRKLLALLDGTKHLKDDFALRPALWKRLLSRLHPGDYAFANVQQAYDALYKGECSSFNARVEASLHKRDAAVLELLKQRPGDFVRRLHKLYALFGAAAVQAFEPVIPKLETAQLLKLRGYLSTINERTHLIYPPNGNWSKAQYLPNTKRAFDEASRAQLLQALGAELSMRLARVFPHGVAMGEGVDGIKLPTNDQELATYGRGTVFHIPKEMTFLRTASFWRTPGEDQSTWFDNSWNFFYENWGPAGTCCWDATHEMWDSAVFSGDPTNKHDLQGRGCQMIDLYLDKLAERGVRYAVWNVLCYSGIPFAQAEEVLATLQWGEAPQRGKLYEPSRAQMVFPLKGNSMTKFVAYVDIVERKLVYMDANLGASRVSARQNADKLSHRMPAFVEYLASLPSVEDLFSHAPRGTTPVLYSDAEVDLPPGERAFVFQPTNVRNQFEPVELGALL